MSKIKNDLVDWQKAIQELSNYEPTDKYVAAIHRIKQLEKELENAKENLRDRFAAKAMINATGAPTDRAKFAYEIADAMLAERNKGREEE